MPDLPVCEVWFDAQPAEPGIRVITEPHTHALLRSNVWLVLGRDRWQILVVAGGWRAWPVRWQPRGAGRESDRPTCPDTHGAVCPCACGRPIPAALSTALLMRREAALGAGEGKRGCLFQPGKPGWAADRDVAPWASRADQHRTIDAWRAACHHDPLPQPLGMIGELCKLGAQSRAA